MPRRLSQGNRDTLSARMDGAEPKKNSTFLKKVLDFFRVVCYYNTRERETPPILKGDTTMERFEWMDTVLTEYAELLDWEAFEADLAEGDPWA